MKKTLKYILTVVYLQQVNAQSPDGISTNLEFWLKADAGTNCIVDGCAITQWSDQANNGQNASNMTSPTYDVHGSNFDPTIDFSGKSMYMVFTTGSNITTRQILYE